VDIGELCHAMDVYDERMATNSSDILIEYLLIRQVALHASASRIEDPGSNQSVIF
jgi:hypothetical protein